MIEMVMFPLHFWMISTLGRKNDCFSAHCRKRICSVTVIHETDRIFLILSEFRQLLFTVSHLSWMKRNIYNNAPGKVQLCLKWLCFVPQWVILKWYVSYTIDHGLCFSTFRLVRGNFIIHKKYLRATHCLFSG